MAAILVSEAVLPDSFRMIRSMQKKADRSQSFFNFYGDDCVMDGEDAKEVYRIYRKELTEKTMQEIKTIPSEEKNFAAEKRQSVLCKNDL